MSSKLVNFYQNAELFHADLWDNTDNSLEPRGCAIGEVHSHRKLSQVVFS